MYGESRFICLFFSFVSTLVCNVMSSPSPACPDRALQTAMGCTAMLGFMGQPSQFAEQSLPERLLHGCQYNTFLDAVDCIERVMTDCHGDTSDAAVYLRSNINVDRMRKSINYFCSNVKEYVSHTECVQNHMGEVSNCSHGAKMNFLSQTQATSDKDVLLRSQCSFISKAVSCMTEVVSSRCSRKIGEIVGNVMKGFEPPICSRSTSYGVVAETGIEDEQVGDDINTGRDDENAACSLPLISLYFALALVLWQHVIKALMS